MKDKLINMALPKKTQSEINKSYSENESKYGYGLCIYIGTEHMKKLGLKEPIDVGTEVYIEAKGVVKSASKSQNLMYNDPNMSMDIQITDLMLGAKDDDEVKAEDAIYS